MASYRNYNDTGAYRSRTIGISSVFGRNTSGGSNLPSCRSSYSGIGSSSARAIAKERALAGFGNAFFKRDKFEEKSTLKYSCAKDSEKTRLHSRRSSSEDVRPSLFEKYSFSAGKTSERPSSVLDRYNRPASREKSKEPEGISRYGSSTYPGSGFARNYGNDGKIEKKDHTVSHKGIRPSSGKASREPSPDINVGKTNSCKVYSRASSYNRSAASPSTSESSLATIPTRSGSTVNSRITTSRNSNERSTDHSSDRLRTSSNKLTNFKNEKESRLITKSEKDINKFLKMEESETSGKLADDEFVTLTIVTRGTSPTPPASSSYVRNKRAEIGIAHKKEVTRLRRLPHATDEEIQCDRVEETSRFSRYSRNSRTSGAPWSTYFDKYSQASAGGSSVFSRGFNNASSSSGRLNNYVYTRNESIVKESSNSSRETQSAGNKNQNDKAFVNQNHTRTIHGNSLMSRDSKIAKNLEIHGMNKELDETRVQNGEQCSCGARRNETTNWSLVNSRTSNQDSTFKFGDDSTMHDSGENYGSYDDQNNGQSPVSKYKEQKQGKAVIARLKHSWPKSEIKIIKYSSKPDLTTLKGETYCERENITPKSDSTLLPQLEQSSRIVEELCQDQNEKVTSHKNNVLQKNDSVSSSSQSCSPSALQSRDASTKNIPRQMTRTSSSESSSVNMPIGRSKSSSANSLTSQGAKIKATTSLSSGKSSGGSVSSSVNLRQGGSPDARGKPPVPKNDTSTVVTSKCIMAAKYVNKDFRKSALNMENGDPSRSKYARKKKNQRNMPGSFQNSANTSEHVFQIASSESSIKSRRSKLKTPGGGTKSVSGKNDSNNSMKLEKSRKGSKSSCEIKGRATEACSSSNSSQSTSASSSSSEDDNECATRSDLRRRGNRTSESPVYETKGKISADTSRTSVLASSADESLMMEKPPRPSSSSRSKSDRSATEEAKSFLMRALAPVTNFFKNKNQDSGDNSKSSGWVDSNDDNDEAIGKSGQQRSARSITHSPSKGSRLTNSEKSDGIKENNTRIQHQSSSDRPRWLDLNSDNVPEGIERINSWNDDVSQETTISTVLPDDGKYKLKIWRQESEERAWRLDDIPMEETKRSSSSASPMSRRGSSRGSFRSADRRNRIRHQQSGERAWWMSDDPNNVPEGVEIIPVAPSDNQNADRSDDSADETFNSSKPLNKIRHIESGEKAWWMDSCSNVPDGVVRIPVETSNSTSDSSESYERIDIGVNPELGTYVKRSLSKFPIEFPPPPSEEPLGDRASPEGVENPPDPPDNYGGRESPYDNVRPTPRRISPRKRPSTLPLYIGEYINIDDVLGDEAILCHSPVLSRVRKQERGEEAFSDNSSECEEIDPTQVIIHDSTPKTPVIQRRNRDNERIQPDGYIPVSSLV